MAIVFQLDFLELGISEMLGLFGHFGQVDLVGQPEVIEVPSVELFGHLDLDAGLDFEPVDVDRLLRFELQTLGFLTSQFQLVSFEFGRDFRFIAFVLQLFACVLLFQLLVEISESL